MAFISSAEPPVGLCGWPYALQQKAFVGCSSLHLSNYLFVPSGPQSLPLQIRLPGVATLCFSKLLVSPTASSKCLCHIVLFLY